MILQKKLSDDTEIFEIKGEKSNVIKRNPRRTVEREKKGKKMEGDGERESGSETCYRTTSSDTEEDKRKAI